MDNFILVGLTGRAGSGKDTVADWFVKHHKFKKMSFAQPIKVALSALDMPEPADRERKEQPIPGFSFTWREAAQKLGTEWGRSLDENLWVKLVQKRLHIAMSNVVISDVRFENEAAMIREMGGTILHIQGRQASLGENAIHVSEAGIELHIEDIVVDNRGSIEELYEQLMELMSE